MWDNPDWVFPELHFSKVDCLFVDGHVQPVDVGAGSPPETLWWYAGDIGSEGWSN
jgi:prepilin-type processing-associated H-X9-DG protein